MRRWLNTLIVIARRYINGNFERLATSDYLCSTCFEKEQHSSIIDERRMMEMDHCQEVYNRNTFDSDSECLEDLPMEEENVHHEQEEVKRKLNYILEFVNVKKIHDL